METPRPRLCVVGSTNTDLIVRTPRLPRPGETLVGHTFQTCHGGKGANQAVTAARLGAEVAFVTKVGRDDFGDAAVRNFEEQGIDTAHVSRDRDRPTGTAVILVDDTAQNCITIVPGANHGLTPPDVRAAAAAIRSARAVLCQLEVPVECSLEAFRLARASGVRTVLNPAPAAALPDELLALTDLCIPNETELAALVGRGGTTETEVADAARQLLARGPRAVLVTLGERGGFFLSADEWGAFPAFAVQPVDTSGAGDAFIGGLAVFLAEGETFPQAVRRASAVAALSVTRPGTQPSFPLRAEVEAFLEAERRAES